LPSSSAARGAQRVRIVAGKHRGRRLLVPPGQTVRPTSDRAREALFNILSHGELAAGGIPFARAIVLDAFAGTGAIGLEALSRGAAEAVFIEQDHEALGVLRKNIATLGEQARTRLLPGDATRPPRAPSGCGVVFLDPPYRSGLAAPAAAALAAAGWFAPGALAVIEMAARDELTLPPGFNLLDQRVYGAVRLVILRRAQANGEVDD
jgi:16S rRNA (guanine966-N2)-methyltransferase